MLSQNETNAERLARVLADIGFGTPHGGVDYQKVSRIVRSRTGVSHAVWPDARLLRLLKGTKEMTLDDARLIAEALKIDLGLLAWRWPLHFRRKRARTVFEEVGPGDRALHSTVHGTPQMRAKSSGFLEVPREDHPDRNFP